MSEHKIILVSSSPRRKELLSKIIPKFNITPHKISENILDNEDGLTYAKRLAKEKANLENIKQNEIFISADTIILFNNTIIGKPTSLEDAKRIISLLSDNKHDVIINRNELLPAARSLLKKNKVDMSINDKCKFKLSGENIRKKMHKILEELYNEKKILDHGMVVGKELAYVLSGGDTNLNKEISEDQMYKLELNSFMKLIETQKTQERISHTLKTGKPLIN